LYGSFTTDSSGIDDRALVVMQPKFTRVEGANISYEIMWIWLIGT